MLDNRKHRNWTFEGKTVCEWVEILWCGLFVNMGLITGHGLGFGLT